MATVPRFFFQRQATPESGVRMNPHMFDAQWKAVSDVAQAAAGMINQAAQAKAQIDQKVGEVNDNTQLDQLERKKREAAAKMEQFMIQNPNTKEYAGYREGLEKEVAEFRGTLDLKTKQGIRAADKSYLDWKSDFQIKTDTNTLKQMVKNSIASKNDLIQTAVEGGDFSGISERIAEGVKEGLWTPEEADIKQRNANRQASEVWAKKVISENPANAKKIIEEDGMGYFEHFTENRKRVLLNVAGQARYYYQRDNYDKVSATVFEAKDGKPELMPSDFQIDMMVKTGDLSESAGVQLKKSINTITTDKQSAAAAKNYKRLFYTKTSALTEEQRRSWDEQMQASLLQMNELDRQEILKTTRDSVFKSEQYKGAEKLVDKQFSGMLDITSIDTTSEQTKSRTTAQLSDAILPSDFTFTYDGGESRIDTKTHRGEKSTKIYERTQEHLRKAVKEANLEIYQIQMDAVESVKEDIAGFIRENQGVSIDRVKAETRALMNRKGDESLTRIKEVVEKYQNIVSEQVVKELNTIYRDREEKIKKAREERPGKLTDAMIGMGYR